MSDSLARLRLFVVILASVVVFIAVAAPIAVIYYQNEATQSATLTVTCVSARSNISQLEALAALEHRLGVPRDFDIPDLPEECR